MQPPVQTWAGEDFHVRPVTGSAATKPYRCPGCDLTILPRVPHVVVWPLLRGFTGSPGTEARRHWHTGCWRRAVVAGRR